MCHFPCAHRHTIAPFFSYFHLPHPCLQHWTSISKHIPWSDHKHIPWSVFVFLTDWGIQIQPFILLSWSNSYFFEQGCLHLHTCTWPQTYTHASNSSWMQPLNKSWGSVSVKGLCHTLWVSHYLLMCLITSFTELLYLQYFLCCSFLLHLLDPSQQSKNSCPLLLTLSKTHSYKAR